MELIWDGLREAVEALARGDDVLYSTAARSLYVSGLATLISPALGVLAGSLLPLRLRQPRQGPAAGGRRPRRRCPPLAQRAAGRPPPDIHSLGDGPGAGGAHVPHRRGLHGGRPGGP